MNWQLGAFAILAVGLAGGFAWYERSKPDARIVALVATLAAFAALGRIAFAALPNVKPTTDIVLISGYALGGAPGFIVGAVAGLSSNFFFGQGPWTPWQMAAWGATGVIGAGLAVVTRGRIGRWPLAIACAATGFAFTAVQDVGDWVNFSDHSTAQLGVYVGKGVGFDAVHAAGCLAFALAFGPWLARSLKRFATRLQVVWLPATLAALALLVCATAAAAATPASYLLSAQNPDGGFGSAPGQPSSALYSGWAALGLEAAGRNLGDPLLRYIRAAPTGDVGGLERTILALRAAGVSAAGPVASLQRMVRPDGSITEQTNLTAFAVLALRAAGVTPRPATVGWLARQQNSDGGFGFATAGGSSDVDDTGAVLEALAGREPPRAVRFVTGQQNPDGGFPSQIGGDSNAQSTAWAVQGLIAAGAGARAVGRGLGYLRSLIAPDGHVRYSRTADQTPVWVTGEALMALAGKALPLAPPVAAPSASVHRAPAVRARPVARPIRLPAAVRRQHRPARRPAAVASPDSIAQLARDAGAGAGVLLAFIHAG